MYVKGIFSLYFKTIKMKDIQIEFSQYLYMQSQKTTSVNRQNKLQEEEKERISSPKYQTWISHWL